MTDIVEQAARVIGAGRLILRDNGKRNNEKIAQALADAGLLHEPARTVPNRAAIAQALYINHRDAIGDNATAIDLAEKGTDAVLELLAGQPTVNEVKARALEEAADAFDALQTQMNEHPSRRDPAVWLIDRAQQIRGGE